MWLVSLALESLGRPGRSLGVTQEAMSEELLQGSEEKATATATRTRTQANPRVKVEGGWRGSQVRGV